MSHSHVIDYVVLSKIPNDLNGTMILDVAMGKGWWGFLIRTEKGGSPLLVGVDISKEYVLKQRNLKIYDMLILSDVRYLPIKQGAFDFILACEIIEHLTKEEGMAFLKDIEDVGSKIIVTTPKGFWETRDLKGYERHISGWEIKEFKERNYEITVVSDLSKILRLVDRIRRLFFRLPKPLKEIVAYKQT